MSSPIPPGASLRDRGLAARQITVARRLVVMAISLVLAVVIWVTFRLHQAARETTSDSAATVSTRAARP